MNNAYKTELLSTAREARAKEITEYQVNIDNFVMAIDMIGDDPEMQPFKDHLCNILTSSRLEQRKAKIMLAAIERQLEVNT